MQAPRARAHLTKLIDIDAINADPKAREAVVEEFVSVYNATMHNPVEICSIAENVIVVKLRMLLSVKHAECAAAEQTLKARMVSMGNVYFIRYTQVVLNHAGDWRAPLCSLAALRFVGARAAAHRWCKGLGEDSSVK